VSDCHHRTDRQSTRADVVRFYKGVSDLAQAGQVCNGAPALEDMALAEGESAVLSTFLKTLNENDT
jgi:hypothetical protein